MNRDALKVFIACAIGAAVGTVVALDVNRYFCWLGFLVGGSIGYLSYEWRGVIRAIPAAYRAAGRINLPSKYLLRCRFRFFLWASAATVSFGVWTCAVYLLEESLAQMGGLLYALLEIGLVILMLPCFLITAVLAMATVITTLTGTSGSEMNGFAGNFSKLTFIISPPTVIFWHLPQGVWFVARKTPYAIVAFIRFALRLIICTPRGIVAATSFCKRFGWQMFIRIHSERRLICGVDALLGSAVGYFAGSAAIGALAGGILGVINYAVVTEHWLRPRGYIRAS
jgi:hypothetical protein